MTDETERERREFVPEFQGYAPVGEMIDGAEQLPLGTPEEEAILRGALAVFSRYEGACKSCGVSDGRDVKRAALMAMRYERRAAYEAGRREIAELWELRCVDFRINAVTIPFEIAEKLDKLLGTDREATTRAMRAAAEAAPPEKPTPEESE